MLMLTILQHLCLSAQAVSSEFLPETPPLASVTKLSLDIVNCNY